jgi:hypothetical protein
LYSFTTCSFAGLAAVLGVVVIKNNANSAFLLFAAPFGLGGIGDTI